MKPITIAGLFFLLLGCSVFPLRSHAAQRRITLVGAAEELDFDTLINAPNGHISFQKVPNASRLWVRSATGFKERT